MSLAERWELMVRCFRERGSRIKAKAWKKKMRGKDPRESSQNNKGRPGSEGRPSHKRLSPSEIPPLPTGPSRLFETTA